MPETATDRLDRFLAETALDLQRLPTAAERQAFTNGETGPEGLRALGFETETVTAPVLRGADRRAREAAFASILPGSFDGNRNLRMTGARSDFLKQIAASHGHALQRAGLSEAALADMARDGVCPNGFAVRHRQPIALGGGNEPENLFMVRESAYRPAATWNAAQLNGPRQGTATVQLAMPPAGTIFHGGPDAVVTRDMTDAVVPKPASTRQTLDLTGIPEGDLRRLANGLSRIRTSQGEYGRLRERDLALEACGLEFERRGLKKPETIETMLPVRFAERPDGGRVAHRHLPGKEPAIVAIHGTLGSMEGRRNAHLEALARDQGRAFIRLDLTGHGLSSGDYTEGTIGRWTGDLEAVMSACGHRKHLLVGASMGGWIALNAARANPEKVSGVIGLAAAPDYSTLVKEGLTPGYRAELARKGVTYIREGDSPIPLPVTQRFLDDASKHLLLNGEGPPIRCPVHLIHGGKDDVVPAARTQEIIRQLRTEQPVQHSLVPNANHGLADSASLAELDRTLKTFLKAGDGRGVRTSILASASGEAALVR